MSFVTDVPEAVLPRRGERRRRLVLAAVVAAVAALGLAALAVEPAPAPTSTPVLPDGNSLPPWPAPADPAAGERAAGLKVAPSEHMVQHFHVHLDILVEGAPVTVPANLGIDVRQQIYAELHTHADSGVVHAEADSSEARFTLGQVFTEWGVRLDAEHLGGLRTRDGKGLWAYVDGSPVAGDPARVVLRDHQEIVLAYGDAPPVEVPRTFDFDAHPV